MSAKNEYLLKKDSEIINKRVYEQYHELRKELVESTFKIKKLQDEIYRILNPPKYKLGRFRWWSSRYTIAKIDKRDYTPHPYVYTVIETSSGRSVEIL